jgi:molybdopterin-guanine dinucleotide biosynthesis protein
MKSPTKYEIQGLVDRYNLSDLDVAIIIGCKTKKAARAMIDGEEKMDRQQWVALVRHVSDSVYGAEY